MEIFQNWKNFHIHLEIPKFIIFEVWYEIFKANFHIKDSFNLEIFLNIR